ncbi:SusD/RagB family nutrient-binding outer membrane lipoprotein [Tenacibaculum finnmarkense]|uniref:SusD/RagB family nutrient-binding outer membrane lipoprotein n=1 Tax=Tenacibaculum finnmarkense TaxID=2781243 RepID=UPI001EFBA270|nr:SusD/RagB family nutrient-binding outer membrane lipoprotein [Tenacibaculum finnmarkense]MCG8804447.1 SusD/RagB family nutrient-binding outer membrane lipoprotein [Tenacibaculum finnmarkense]MCG8855813.1 SusD/RagB family nutrient-binding outer membrane lipoprotein [Tenacibaculum finnmarkense]
MKLFRNILLGTAVLSLGACSDYLDVNTDLNNPTQVTKGIQLPAALLDSYSGKVVNGNIYGNVLMGSWSGNILNFTGAYDPWTKLDIKTGDVSWLWNSMYLGVSELDNIIQTSTPGVDDYYKAIALINKSFYMQTIVDLWGNVPYSEAFKGGKNLSPAYDDQKEIYRALVANLNQAISLINNADPVLSNIPSTAEETDKETGVVITPSISQDIVYQGDMTKWVKLANTVKLRLLVRQSDLTDAETVAHINKEKASLTQNGGLIGVGETVTINPGFNNSNEDKNSPFYNRFHDSEGKTNNWYAQSAAAQHAINFLNGNLTGVADPRLKTLYNSFKNDAGDDEYAGIKQGALKAESPKKVSSIGAIPFKGGAEANGILISSAQSLFLQSEAVTKGLISGDAKALFESGVRESLSHHGITSDEIEAYMSKISTINKLGWDASTNKIEAIMTQKWIALNSVNAIESFIEYSRTGFPATPMPLRATSNKKPNRFPYPDSEYSGNTANVTAQGVSQNDIFTKTIFWDTTK